MLPYSLALPLHCPGGYRIRPYGVGVDARIDPGALRWPQHCCGRTLFAPTGQRQLYYCIAASALAPMSLRLCSLSKWMLSLAA